MKARIVTIILGLALAWGMLIFKAALVQVIPDERLQKLNSRQYKKMLTLRSRRGAIFDRNGKELAITVSSYSLFADPPLIEDPTMAAKKLSEYFGGSYRSYLKMITREKRRFVWLQRRLSKIDRDVVRSWKIRGLSFIEEPKRVYPNDRLLSHVLGFIGSDDQGLEGLELKFDNELQGTTKTINLKKDARGRPLLLNGRLFVDNPDGNNLHLTIDNQLQYKLERELELAVDSYDADSAMGVILDAKTSQILAMANAPAYDLNRPRRYGSEYRRNKTVTDAYEQGSTVKTLTIAGALARGIVKPNTNIDCENGKFKIGRQTISESDGHKFGKISVTEILSFSSNIGTTKIAFEMGDELLRQTLTDFGLGQRTKVDLPGESAGILHKLPWRDHLLSNISFGHGLTATALQIANAYAAIANGGVLNRPYVVLGVEDTDANEISYRKSTPVRRVLTEDVAETMRLMLTQATAVGATGERARITGFPVAGKTGTAQKVDNKKGGYKNGEYISSFAGFVPANDPQFVIYVALDNPRTKYYASEVAAPVFSKLAQYAVLKSGLSPVIVSEGDIIRGRDKLSDVPGKMPRLEKSPKRTPHLVGLSLRSALRRINGTDLKVKIVGSGVVAKTEPSSGQLLPDDRQVKLYLSQQ